MPLVDTAPLLWPVPVSLGENPAFSDDLIDGATEKSACLVNIPETGTLTHVEFFIDNASSTDQLDIRLETRSLSTGDPSGTLYDVNGTGTIADPSAVSNSWVAVAINGGTGITVTKGDELCIVKDFNSWTSGNVEIRHFRNSGGRYNHKIQWHDTGSGFSADSQGYGNVALRYSGTVYHPIPEATCFTGTRNQSGQLERGVRFKIPFPAQFMGCHMHQFRPDATTADITFNLYADATAPGGTPLASFFVDGDARSSGNFFSGSFPNWPTSVELDKDTFYRLTLEHSGASNILNSVQQLNSVALKSQFPGTQDFSFTIDDGGGGWTDTDTEILLIQLVLNKLDDGTGGGGGGTGGIKMIGQGGGLIG